MEAQYETTCPCGCNQPIRVGDEIENSTQFGWVRKGHAAPRKVCPKCFTTRANNGSCACD